MRPILLCLVTLALSETAFGQATVEIALKHGTPAEVRTREQLQRLLTTYDLSPWIYTKSIVIDERAIPFSHPVRTLRTKKSKGSINCPNTSGRPGGGEPWTP